MIREFNQRMHHALAMDDDIHPLRRHRKKPYGLNQLKALIHHGGGIDRDLRAHAPVGVVERLLTVTPRQFFFRPAEKRAAGGVSRIFSSVLALC